MSFEIGPEFPEDAPTKASYRVLLDELDLRFADELLPAAATNGLVRAVRQGTVYAPTHGYDRCTLQLIYEVNPGEGVNAYHAAVSRFPLTPPIGRFMYTKRGGFSISADGSHMLVLPSQYGIMRQVILATELGPILDDMPVIIP